MTGVKEEYEDKKDKPGQVEEHHVMERWELASCSGT